MNAALNHISTHMEDKFYWPAHSFHGKPLDLLDVEDKIDELEARFIRRSDEWPLPYVELEEIEDEIEQLEKVKTRIWNEWQKSISDMRKGE
jgi:hypothetical protein